MPKSYTIPSGILMTFPLARVMMPMNAPPLSSWREIRVTSVTRTFRTPVVLNASHSASNPGRSMSYLLADTELST
ncbi:hypothetical protein CcI49_27560 [Frankia sp. CcI49]|nr:hypothetical protein CcI49_27560 [Frankia sp. CcI49]